VDQKAPDVIAPHSRTPALFIALGGLLLIVGSLMDFGRPEAPRAGAGVPVDDPIRGVDTADGKFFLVVGLALLVAAVIHISDTSSMVETVGVMFSVFASLLVFYMSLADLFTLDDVQAGLFLVVVGAALGAIGGSMSLLTYRRRIRTPV
jgi:hypothetical protein